MASHKKTPPSRLQLLMRGVPIHPLSCPLCQHFIEDRDHALFECRFAKSVWEAVFSWCGISVQPIPGILELPSQRLLNLVPPKNRGVFDVILLSTAWMIWKARNLVGWMVRIGTAYLYYLTHKHFLTYEFPTDVVSINCHHGPIGC